MDRKNYQNQIMMFFKMMDSIKTGDMQGDGKHTEYLVIMYNACMISEWNFTY